MAIDYPYPGDPDPEPEELSGNNADGSGLDSSGLSNTPPPTTTSSSSSTTSSSSTSVDGVRDAEVNIEADVVKIEGEVEGLENENPAQDPAQDGGQGGDQGTPKASLPATGLGAAGPLTVDSVGDYLEDHDPEEWAVIDEADRERAERLYADIKKRESDNSAEGRQAARDAKAKERQDKIAAGKAAGDAKKARMAARDADDADDAPDADDAADAADADDADDADGLIADIAAKKLGEIGVEGLSGETGPAGVSDSLTPIGPLATPEQLAAQPLIDFGTGGTSSYDVPGQTSNASEDAVVKATDSVATATAAIVNILDSFAATINMLSDRVTLIDNQLDAESDPDGG
tara:strand:- start:2288 stop:3325 length:1038 start_codon:yes stop_codon:yes gene_type:complete